jgi:hypothetical protein
MYREVLDKGNVTANIVDAFVMHLSALVISIFLVSATGCNRKESPLDGWQTNHVKASPEETLSVLINYSSNDNKVTGWNLTHLKARKFQLSETYKIVVSNEMQNVTWEGNAAPRVLRRHGGILYMVAYDRVSKGLENDIFRLFKEENGQFVEIDRGEFPKAIAVQNMGFDPLPFGCGDRSDRYESEVTASMNPDDPCFLSRMTAHLWVYLETGKQYHESLRNGVKTNFLKSYMQKYAPRPIL